MTPILIIPAYQPNKKLLALVESIRQNSDLPILIVNDGSSQACSPLFDKLNQLPDVSVIAHAINLGKGQALKTAFNHVLTHFPKSQGVITADADGQHLVKDILQVADMFRYKPDHLILGARSFCHKVPWKSRFGNNLTKIIFHLLIGQSLKDTQTGLRAIPKAFLKQCLKTQSNGYEFELDMLIKASKQNVKIHEVEIETVYNDNNKGTHFNPIIDSFKIYFVFLRFLVFAMICGLLDFGAFVFSYWICGNILVSEGLARLFSGTCNFLFNKELVFKSKDSLRFEALKYTLLCLVNLIFSYALIQSLIFIGVNVFASKLIALFGLFIANFAIQKLIVFNPPDEAIQAR